MAARFLQFAAIPTMIVMALAQSSACGSSISINLADIVGGGNGTGTGGNQGINYSGGVQTTHAGSLNPATNAFSTSTNPFVDGVFVPDGGPGGSAVITVSSTGTTVTGISDSNLSPSATWDYIWNGHNMFVASSLTPATLIGFHSNKGITFDLNAIEAANPGFVATTFTTTASSGNQAGGFDLYVAIDGNIVSTNHFSNANRAVPVMVNIGASDRFLTLISSSAGGLGFDWGFFGDPIVTLQSSSAVPEPSTFTMLGIAAIGLIGLRKRKQAAQSDVDI